MSRWRRSPYCGDREVLYTGPADPPGFFIKMDIVCGSCGTEYEFEDDKVTESGITVIGRIDGFTEMEDVNTVAMMET